jgi:GTP-binding protein
MNFIDEALIDVSSGKGGAGSVHFMRQSYMPKMGPDGGDGGRGGSIYFMATTSLQSLLDFRFTKKFHADNGQDGMGRDKNGKKGEDLYIKVPVGTVVKDAETGAVLADIVEPEVPVLFLKGGRGGLGNMNFTTSTRQSPNFAQPGEKGQAKKIKLELKLLADVGLVAFPNAGKSSLISKLSAAKPKIANYPFTTLVPNLGVVRSKGRDWVLADIPGIIEGASQGKGLGHRFLKHCERTRLLVILLDSDPHTGRNLLEEYEILISELKAYSTELAKKKRIVVVSKADIWMDGYALEEREGYKEISKKLKKKPLAISSHAGIGLGELQKNIEDQLKKLGERKESNKISHTIELGPQELFDENHKKED